MPSALDHLILDILYDIKKDKFEVSGNINKQGKKQLIEVFLSDQIGAGRDDRKPNIQDTYHIRLEWYPEGDIIKVTSNTGNKGLRDGILMRYMKYLDEQL